MSHESIPNFAYYLDQAVRRLHREGMVTFSLRELNTMGWICAQEGGGPVADPIAERLAYELDELELPKWVALTGWLSPFGVCAARPVMLLRLARYLLGVTTAVEDGGVPKHIQALMSDDQ